MSIILGDKKYRQLAASILEGFVGVYPKYGYAAAEYVLALYRYFKDPILITIIGKKKNQQTERLLRTANEIYEPMKVVRYVTPPEERSTRSEPRAAYHKIPVAIISRGTNRLPLVYSSDELVAALVNNK